MGRYDNYLAQRSRLLKSAKPLVSVFRFLVTTNYSFQNSFYVVRVLGHSTASGRQLSPPLFCIGMILKYVGLVMSMRTVYALNRSVLISKHELTGIC